MAYVKIKVYFQGIPDIYMYDQLSDSFESDMLSALQLLVI